ncbi:MAG: LPS translocon maturation chaperone LptM [Brachymonas sp.]
MLNFKPIVGLSLCVAVLAACGQKGALMHPKEPAAQNRATLPQVLNPASSASAPASPASAPKR